MEFTVGVVGEGEAAYIIARIVVQDMALEANVWPSICEILEGTCLPTPGIPVAGMGGASNVPSLSTILTLQD